MRRLMSRRTVLWDGMGFPSTRHGWMAALLASFLALFVLVSAVDAAACAPEAGRAQAAAASGLTHAVVADADHDKGGGAADHVACAHGVRTLLILTADAGQSDPSPSVRAASATRFQKVQTASLYRFMSASLTMN